MPGRLAVLAMAYSLVERDFDLFADGEVIRIESGVQSENGFARGDAKLAFQH